MSCYWHIHCPQCDARNEGSLNHGDDVMQSVLDVLPHIGAIYDGDECGYLSVAVMGSGDAISFVREHHGHPLIVKNEYGHTAAEEYAIVAAWKAEQVTQESG